MRIRPVSGWFSVEPAGPIRFLKPCSRVLMTYIGEAVVELHAEEHGGDGAVPG